MARLGQGPFEIVGFWTPDETLRPGDPRPSEGVDVCRCACCGARVAWRVLIRNTVDGEHHIVGRTCAVRAAEFLGTAEDRLKAEFAKKQREHKRALERAAWEAEEAARQQKELETARARFVANIDQDYTRHTKFGFAVGEFYRAVLSAMAAERFENLWDAPLFPELGRVTTDD